MKKSSMRRMALLLGTVLSMLTAMLVTSGAASADVYWCGAQARLGWNQADAHCDGGFGRFRVGATCNSPRWPYTTTIYSDWAYRHTGDKRVYTVVVFGEDYACHITKAWVDV
jgi:hypothetical protein